MHSFFEHLKFFSAQKTSSFAMISPIVFPGLKPISIKRHLSLLPHRFHVDLPDTLVKEIISCKDNKEVRQVGIDWCIEQSKELKAAGVPFLHYYSMGKADNIQKIATAVF